MRHPGGSVLTVTFNTFGDFPVVKRVEGSVNLKLNAYLETPFSKSERSTSGTSSKSTRNTARRP
jgi:hypothetical protein